jgi:hypothetical protein
MAVLDPVVGTEAQATAEIGDLQVIEIDIATAGGPGSAVVHWAPVAGLPNVILYVRPTTLDGAAVGVTFTPVASYSVGRTTNVASNWEPLTTPQALAANVPTYFRDWIPGATAIGIQLNVPAPAAGSFIARCIIGASG